MIFDQSSPRSSVSLDPPFVQMFWLSAFSRSLADGDLVFNHKEHLRMWWKDVKVEAGSTRAALAQTINPLMTMNLSTPSGCDNTIAHIGNNYSLQSMVVLPYQCPRPNNHKIISRKSISNRNDVLHATAYLWPAASLGCLIYYTAYWCAEQFTLLSVWWIQYDWKIQDFWFGRGYRVWF